MSRRNISIKLNGDSTTEYLINHLEKRHSGKHVIASKQTGIMYSGTIVNPGYHNVIVFQTEQDVKKYHSNMTSIMQGMFEPMKIDEFLSANYLQKQADLRKN